MSTQTSANLIVTTSMWSSGANGSNSMENVTQILAEVRKGSAGAADCLLELVYDELRRMATRALRSEKVGQSLQSTALVHEVWMRLMPAESGQDAGWENRRHFFGAAAEAMRRILVEKARSRKRLKRGGPNAERMNLDESMVVAKAIEDDVLDLHAALDCFEKVDSVKAYIVKLKFFVGLTNEEVAEVTKLSLATVERYWAYARAWLHHNMSQ